jgi:hypothetical protein
VKLEDLQVGMKVVYEPANWPRAKQFEEGVVTSKNAWFVFVRYGADYGSKATRPEDLQPLIEEAS